MQKYVNLISVPDLNNTDIRSNTDSVSDNAKMYTASSRIQELKEKIRSTYSSLQKMEATVKSLASTYFSLLQQTQMFTLDLMLCQYLNGLLPLQKITEYIEYTVYETQDLYNFSKESSKHASLLFNSLIGTAKSITATLQSSKIALIPASQINLRFDEYLNRVSELQKEEIAKAQAELKEFPAFDLVIQKMLDFPIVEPLSPEQIINFRDYMLKEFNITDNMSQSFFSISQAAHRIVTLKQLQEYITISRSLIQNTDPKDPSTYTPFTIRNSPFFKSLSARSAFLRHALSLQERELACVSDFDTLIESCCRAFSMYHEECRSSINDIKQQIISLNNVLDSHQESSFTLQTDVSPAITSFIKEIQFFDSEEIRSEVSNLCSQVITTCKPSSNELLTDWNSFENKISSQFFKEIIDTEILYENLYSMISSLAKTDISVLELTAKATENEVYTYYNGQELESLSNLENKLKNVMESLKKVDVSVMIKSMNDICDSVIKAKAKYDQAEQKLNSKFEKNEKSEEKDTVESLNKEIKDLKEESLNLAKVASQKQILISRIEELTFDKDHADVRPINPVQATMLNKYVSRVMCPICKRNRRNVILSTCGHCFCSDCLSQRNACPVCNVSFTQNQVARIQL